MIIPRIMTRRELLKVVGCTDAELEESLVNGDALCAEMGMPPAIRRIGGSGLNELFTLAPGVAEGVRQQREQGNL